MICRKCIVRGRVQGVFYRASTQQQAEILHINGHARNLRNGDVEVLMQGDEKAIAKLEKWLLQGPDYAEVTGVECQNYNPEENEIPDHFSIGW